MSEKKQELGDPVEVFGDLFSKLYIYMAKEMKNTREKGVRSQHLTDPKIKE